MKNIAILLLILCCVLAGISCRSSEKSLTEPSADINSRSPAPSAEQAEAGKLQLDFEKKSISYRNKYAVYARIKNMLETEIIPILIKGVKAKRFLNHQRKDAVTAVSYNSEKERNMVDKIIYAIFYDNILQLEKVLKAENIELPPDIKQEFSISGFKQRFNPERFPDKKIDLYFSDNEIEQKIFENNIFEPISIFTGLTVKIALLLPQDMQEDYDRVTRRYELLVNKSEIDNVNEQLFSEIPRSYRKCYYEPYAKRIFSIYQDFYIKTKK